MCPERMWMKRSCRRVSVVIGDFLACACQLYEVGGPADVKFYWVEGQGGWVYRWRRLGAIAVKRRSEEGVRVALDQKQAISRPVCWTAALRRPFPRPSRDGESLIPIHPPAGLTSFACEADAPARPIRPPVLPGQSSALAVGRAPPAVAGGGLAGLRRPCLRFGSRRYSAGIPPARRGRR